MYVCMYVCMYICIYNIRNGQVFDEAELEQIGQEIDRLGEFKARRRQHRRQILIG